jgi:hypothetical protein
MDAASVTAHPLTSHAVFQDAGILPFPVYDSGASMACIDQAQTRGSGCKVDCHQETEAAAAAAAAATEAATAAASTESLTFACELKGGR